MPNDPTPMDDPREIVTRWFQQMLDNCGDEYVQTIVDECSVLTFALAARVPASRPDPSGADLIAAERQRQIEAEGWTPEHDDEATNAQLSRAARAYLIQAEFPIGSAPGNCPSIWPWDLVWWKPSEDPIRNLVMSGALIAAEIDRRKRAEP